jgi:RNA polymerase sigma factor (sigma-70 family)
VVAVRLTEAQRSMVAEQQPAIEKVVATFIARRPDVLQRQSREDMLQEARVAFCMGLVTHTSGVQATPEVYALGAVRLHLNRFSGQCWRETTTDADVEDELAAEPDEADTSLLAKILRRLKPAERKVLRLRYGLGGVTHPEGRPHTVAQAAERLGVSSNTVQRMQKRAEANLARYRDELTGEPK